uniref:Solute carrier family 12 member 3 n=1 Tax=Pseudonaja textilis TaxID=8673 RepID=A0A670ZMF1_PSETE
FFCRTQHIQSSNHCRNLRCYTLLCFGLPCVSPQGLPGKIGDKLWGWRPSFRYFSKWTALFGSIVSVVIMFLLTWWAALIVVGVIIVSLAYVTYKKPEVNWGSSVQAGTYNMALSNAMNLTNVEDHVKNFRPQCLVLSGPPNFRPALVDFVGAFTKNVSLMICGNVTEVSAPFRGQLLGGSRTTHCSHLWLSKRKIQAFYNFITIGDLRSGARSLMQVSGLGRLKPNTIVLGYKNDWQTDSPPNLENYVGIIQELDEGYSIAIHKASLVKWFMHLARKWELCGTSLYVYVSGGVFKVGADANLETVFQSKQKKKNIDIYWLFDDGGLTLLIPYLLTRRKRWSQCKVRVFISGKGERAGMMGRLKSKAKQFQEGAGDVSLAANQSLLREIINARDTLS